MTTTPLPPHAIAVDHPNFPERHWTGFELAWIAARDKQFLAHSNQARADLEAENKRLREFARKYVEWVHEENHRTKGTTFWERVEMCRELDELARAAAQGFRDGVASVQQETVGWLDPETDTIYTIKELAGSDTDDLVALCRPAAPVAQQQEKTMATEEYQVGYEAGYQDGWNAAQQPQAEAVSWGIDWGTHGDRTCVSIIKKHSDGTVEVVATEYEPERLVPQQAEAVPAKEDFCYCNDEISLQIVSGGGAPEGLYGRVTLRVNGEYVNYVRADSWQETPRARALEFVARHKSSDWPERCQQMVDMARAALAAPQQAEAVPSVQIVNCNTCKHNKAQPEDYPCNRCGVEFGDGPFNRWEAPQHAEAVPPGYAGVTVWVGNKQVTRIATETEIRHEREPGFVLKQAALMAVAIAAAQGAKT